MDNVKTAIAVATGAAIGAVLGILFAPGRGSSTRKKIKGKGKDYLDAMESSFDGIFSEANDKVEQLKKEVNSLPKLEKK